MGTIGVHMPYHGRASTLFTHRVDEKFPRNDVRRQLQPPQKPQKPQSRSNVFSQPVSNSAYFNSAYFDSIHFDPTHFDSAHFDSAYLNSAYSNLPLHNSLIPQSTQLNTTATMNTSVANVEPAMMPTEIGCVLRTTYDGMVQLEATLQGRRFHAPRRLRESERNQAIQSGAVFIYEEGASGIKRWTDGKSWSPSRLMGNYLIYREVNQQLDGGDKRRPTKRRRSDAGPPQDYTDDEKKFYVGSLTDTYDFKQGGLMKKTISIKYRGSVHHIVSYYTLEDVRLQRLRRPGQIEDLRDIRPRNELLQGTAWKIRPDIEDDVPVSQPAVTTVRQYVPSPIIQQHVPPPIAHQYVLPPTAATFAPNVGLAADMYLPQHMSEPPPKKPLRETTRELRERVKTKLSTLTPHENIYTIPNVLTFSRLLAAPVVGYLVLHDQHAWAVGLFAYAGITDLIDGWIARKWNLQTVVGSVVDPMADKMLMTILVGCLAIKGAMPLWLATLILGRDISLAIAAIYYRYASLPSPKTFTRYWDFSLPSAEVHPTTVSKFNTFLQIGLIGATTTLPLVTSGALDSFLVNLSPSDIESAVRGLGYVVASTTLWSGASYAWNRKAVKILGSDEALKEKQGRRGRAVVGVSFAAVVGLAAWLAANEKNDGMQSHESGAKE